MRLAVAQTPGELSGREARLRWLEDILENMEPADLLVLPEGFACGYFIARDLSKLAEPHDGPSAQQIAKLGQKHKIAILYGYAERDGDEIFNSAQCIGADGRPMHHHRKLVLPPGFEPDHFTSGRGAGLFDFHGLKIGALICYDFEFPETVRHLARRGADLVLVPTALGAKYTVVADAVTRARAFENGIYLAYANHCGMEAGHSYAGLSVIAGPDGDEIAKAGDGPEVIYAEIEQSAAVQAKAHIPYIEDAAKLVLG